MTFGIRVVIVVVILLAEESRRGDANCAVCLLVLPVMHNATFCFATLA